MAPHQSFWVVGVLRIQSLKEFEGASDAEKCWGQLAQQLFRKDVEDAKAGLDSNLLEVLD